VRDVDVPAQHKFTLAFELCQVRVKLGQKAVFGQLPLFARRAAGKVGADDGALAGGRVKAQFHIAALGVKLARAIAHHHVAGRVPGVNAHAGVAFFLGKVKVALQVGQGFELARHVFGLGLDFLHANTIRLQLGQPRLKPLAGGRTNAVEVKAA
jgi:hypothetical protein